MNIIKSISYSNTEILQNIMALYCPAGFEADLTYSKGNFYKDGLIPQPKYKFDLNPVVEGVVQADSRKVPLESNFLSSIIFDPPFVVAPSPKPGIIRDRFGCYKNAPELWNYYTDSIKESHRLLKQDGLFVFKCQDIVSAGKNWFLIARFIKWRKPLAFTLGICLFY